MSGYTTPLIELPMSADLYFTYRDETQVFEDIGCWVSGQVSVTGPAEPEQLAATSVTAGLLPLLSVQPVIGRRFTEEDDSPGAPPTIMLSYAYWQGQLGADPEAMGSTLRVDGSPREIIGVLPPAFALPRQGASIYIPFQWDRFQSMGRFGGFEYQAIARLSSGATIEQANTDVERLLLSRLPADTPFQIGAYTRPLKQDFVGDIGNVLWVLLGTVAIVLVIACANVANLFFVRAEGRQREVAVRTALGATRGHIARQLLLESLVLGLLGGVTGLGLAVGGLRLLTWMRPATVPRLHEIAVDPTVLAFTLGMALLCGLLFGLFPAFRVDRLDLVASLKEGGRGGSVGTERHRTRHTLVVAQIAMALVLLAGSGLMLRSFQVLRTVDAGFSNPEGVLTFRVAIPAAEVEDPAEVAVAYEDIWRGLRRIPGVTAVGASSSVAMDGFQQAGGFWAEEDLPPAPGRLPPVGWMKYITGDYFQAMQIPLLAGRPIEWSDIRARAPVGVVTENLAVQRWGSPAAALGHRITVGGDPTRREIIGVVGNIHDQGVSQPAPTVFFWPMVVENMSDASLLVRRAMTFAVRTTRPTSASLLPEVRAGVWAVNPSVPLANVRTLDEILAQSMVRTSFTLVMLAIAATVALTLGVVGIYGAISYIMSERTREIGVRMALGADRRDVRRMVLRQGLALAGIGVVIGLVAAVGLTRFMSSLLYGVEATDPVTFAAAAAVLTAVAIVASYLPAVRASRTDPLVALRFE